MDDVCLFDGRLHAMLKSKLSFPAWCEKIRRDSDYRQAVFLAAERLAEQDKQQKQDQAQNKQQQRKNSRLPPDAAGDPNNPNPSVGRWGLLPAKLHQDATNAANQQPPGRWGELIKRYRARLADVD